MYNRKVIGLQEWVIKTEMPDMAELAGNDFKTIVIGRLEDSEDRKSREMKSNESSRWKLLYLKREMC